MEYWVIVELLSLKESFQLTRYMATYYKLIKILIIGARDGSNEEC